MKWVLLCLLLVNLVLSLQEVEQTGSGSKLPGALSHSRKPETQRCYLVGPISKLIEAESVLNELQLIDGASRLVYSDVKLPPKFWVHIPPLVSRKAAIEKMRLLKSQGVDSFVITAPDLNNAISLGVFDNIDSAERMINLQKSRGVQAKLRVRERVSQVYWIYTSHRNDDEKTVRKRLQSGGQEFREIFCKTVDS